MSGRLQKKEKQSPHSDENAVDLWYLNHLEFAEGEVLKCCSLLSLEEQSRADAFRFEKDRRQFSVARANLRMVLGQYLDTEPGTIEFEFGVHGKPFIQNCPFHFNVAHSTEHILIGVCRDREIGVDIEALRISEGRMKPLVRNICTSEEKRWVEALKEEAVEVALSRLWTAKEAALKAVGSGFQIPPDKVEVSQSVLTGSSEGSEVSSQSFSDFQCGKVGLLPLPDCETAVGCSAAVAIKGAGSIRTRWKSGSPL